MNTYVPTILNQLIAETKSGKYCIVYYLNGPNSCNCIGFKPKNIITKKYILFSVCKEWVDDFLNQPLWRESFLKNDCEIAMLGEYESVLRGNVENPNVELIGSYPRKI